MRIVYGACEIGRAESVQGACACAPTFRPGDLGATSNALHPPCIQKGFAFAVALGLSGPGVGAEAQRAAFCLLVL